MMNNIDKERRAGLLNNVFAFISAKGGTGTSSLTALLALALGKLGKKAVVVDYNAGYRTADMLLGLESRIVYDMLDVLKGDCALAQGLVPHSDYEGLKLLTAPQGAGVKDMDTGQLKTLFNGLAKEFDYVLIDCPTENIDFLAPILNEEYRHIIVTTSDDIALRNQEKIIDWLHQKGKERPSLIVNKVVPKWIKEGKMPNPQNISQVLDIPLLGAVPYDDEMVLSLFKGQGRFTPGHKSEKSIGNILRRLMGETVPFHLDFEKGLAFFQKWF